MKPVAIGATLLLHTATLGVIAHLGSTPSTSHPGSARLEVRVLSKMSMSAGVSIAQERRSVPHTVADNSTLRTTENLTLTHAKRAPARATSIALAQAKVIGAPLISVGTKATAPSASGVLISANYAATNRKPTYPYLSIKQEEEGTVWLRTLVRTDGSAGEVKVGKSSGHPLLDSAAISAVRSWRFVPATVNNQPVERWYQLPIQFTLPPSNS